jgi:predicted YcjX-like family ATPase
MFNIEGKLIINPQILADTYNKYFSKVVDESVINITKQDHNQISQHSYLEYLVHESHQPFLQSI